MFGPVTSDVDLGDKDQKRSTFRKAIVEFRCTGFCWTDACVVVVVGHERYVTFPHARHRNRPADLPEELSVEDVVLRQGWLFKNKAKRSK